jgi:hypothetical protein
VLIDSLGFSIASCQAETLAAVARMGVSDAIKKFFGASTATPADEPRLSGASETTLGRELQGLSSGARAWITMAEAAALFSEEQPNYAFGDFDDAGKTRLAQFAAEHRCAPDFRPMEGRVYFNKGRRSES